MKALKVLSLCLAILLCLSSCGIIIINDQPGKNPVTTDTETEPEGTETSDPKEIILDKKTSDEMKEQAKATLDGLSTLKLNGMRLLIAAVDDTFYGGDGSATLLTSDRVERAKAVAGKLDADVSVVTFSDEELCKRLTDTVGENRYFADVLAVPARLVGRLVNDGLIKSIRTVANMDLKAGYFDPDAMKAFSAGHCLYALTGEGCFEPEKLYCVYFNRELAKSLGYDMYSLLSSGKFTLEKYAECAAAAEAAGKASAVLSDRAGYKKMLLTGSGFDYTENGTDKVPAANTFSDGYKALTELFASLPDAQATADAKETFLEGGSLFYIDTVAAAETMSTSELAWGVLPFPKYSGEAEYKTYISPEATVLCIPVGAADDRSSGDFIEALCAASEGYIKYDYIYYNMLNVLRDNGSVNSLNIIINNPNYDFAPSMKDGYPTLYANTVTSFEQLISGRLTFEEYKEKETDFAEYLAKWFPVTHK